MDGLSSKNPQNT